MRFAFGDEWHARNAQARTDATAITQALANPQTRVLPVWRGKPHLAGDAVCWAAVNDPILKHAKAPFLYLGQHDNRDLFAADISAWEPDALDRAALAMFTDTSIQIHPAAPKGAYFGELRLAMVQLSRTDAALAATARALFNWHRTHRFCAACGQPSQTSAAGWERVCTVCAAKHFPRTDPVVIMLVTHGNNLLLGRSHGWPERMYSALAGFIEPGETLESAVAREVSEETGIAVRDIRYLASQPWPFPNSLMFGCIAHAENTELTLDDELEDALWMSREDVLLAWSGHHENVLPARKGSIAHYMIGQWLSGQV
ncbi:NAD(+) diphosphatase [Roseinatronobacter monicus]|uniref:NAD(+) diphosphatase n=1 Tax=Roseinatronobacter monicus TaxID=393481 RepID=A0A543KDI4_9RHOB|nr:NAD(+) diphosphatase [Roseinatronobacter monicus]TQM93143.1 NAD+ diphosphatase [Roseinatronobacter monicus]